MHLKQMAKVYAPSSIVVRESDHYALDSVLVKVRSAHTRMPQGLLCRNEMSLYIGSILATFASKNVETRRIQENCVHAHYDR